jgi:hypothetical protein
VNVHHVQEVCKGHLPTLLLHVGPQLGYGGTL